MPRDLSVVGYNDIPDAERSDPPLTTVDGLGVQKGRAAARIVFEGGPPRHEILKPRLIMRAQPDHHQWAEENLQGGNQGIDP